MDDRIFDKLSTVYKEKESIIKGKLFEIGGLDLMLNKELISKRCSFKCYSGHKIFCIDDKDFIRFSLDPITFDLITEEL